MIGDAGERVPHPLHDPVTWRRRPIQHSIRVHFTRKVGDRRFLDRLAYGRGGGRKRIEIRQSGKSCLFFKSIDACVCVQFEFRNVLIRGRGRHAPNPEIGQINIPKH